MNFWTYENWELYPQSPDWPIGFAASGKQSKCM